MDIDWLLLKEYDRNIFSVQNMFGNKEFQGYQRSASGYPVTLNNCMSTQPVLLSIEGNTLQDGDPTPDNPVEVVGVGEGITAFANLTPIFDDEIGEITTTQVQGAIINQSANYIHLTPGKPYFVISKTVPQQVSVICYDENKNFITVFQDNYIFENQFIVPFICPENGKYLMFAFVESSENIENTKYYVFEGKYQHDSDMPEHLPKPYAYKIPIKIESGNEQVNIFEIYMPQPIYKVGNLSDCITIDLKNKKAKMIQKIVYGNINDLSWNYSDTDDIYVSFNEHSYYQIEANTEILSNRFKYKPGYNDSCEKIYGVELPSPQILIKMKKERFDYAYDEDLPALWMDAGEKWFKTNETTKVYAKKNVVEIDISSMQNWNSVPSSLEGTITISTDTALPPNSIEAKYSSLSWEK